MTASDEDVLIGLVSVTVGGATFGVPVLKVQDVIAAVRIDLVPRAPEEVAGSLNLRGRIVTAIDMTRRLSLSASPTGQSHMSVIVEHGGELYALQVDDVGDVLWLPASSREPTPVTLSPEWRQLCEGLHRLDGELMLVLSIPDVLALTPALSTAA